MRTSEAGPLPFGRSSVVRGALPGAAFIFLRVPDVFRAGAGDGSHEDPTRSAPNAVEFNFRGHPEALALTAGGRAFKRTPRPMSGGTTDGGGVEWLSHEGPSESLEIRPSAALRAEMAAECRRPDLASFDEVRDDRDPALVAAALRRRAHALGVRPMTDLEADEVVRDVIRGRIVAMGGRPPRGRVPGLDPARLARVDAYLRRHPRGRLTLARLADVADVSRAHFARMFRRATGMAPHAYLTALRMERAARLLEGGAPVAVAAEAVGYRPGHAFRTAFRAAHGIAPGALAAR